MGWEISFFSTNITFGYRQKLIKTRAQTNEKLHIMKKWNSTWKDQKTRLEALNQKLSAFWFCVSLRKSSPSRGAFCLRSPVITLKQQHRRRQLESWNHRSYDYQQFRILIIIIMKEMMISKETIGLSHSHHGIIRPYMTKCDYEHALICEFQSQHKNDNSNHKKTPQFQKNIPVPIYLKSKYHWKL